MKGLNLFHKKEKTQRIGVTEEVAQKKGVPKTISLCLMVISMLISYELIFFMIGNGFYTYSDEIYDQLEVVMKAAVNLGSVESEGGETETTKESAEAAEKEAAEKAVDLSRLNIQILEEGTDYYGISGSKDGAIITCYIKNGVFKAERKMHISEGEFKKITKNYESQKQYIQIFKTFFGFFVIAGGVLIDLILEGAIRVFSKLLEIIGNYKEKKADKSSEVATTNI